MFVLFLPSTYSQSINKEQRFNKNRTQEQGELELKSRMVNFEKKEFQFTLPKNKQFKRIYIKLKKPITKSIKNKLKKQGIILKEYIADNTYIAKLNDHNINTLKKEFYIYGFADIDYADKMPEYLYRGNISSHAKDGNYAKVVVSFYEDEPYNEAVSSIRYSGGIIKSNNFTQNKELTASIDINGLQSLAELDEVKYIEEIPPSVKANNIEAGKLSNAFWDNESGALSGLYDYPYYIKGNSVMFYNYLLSCML